MDHFRSGIGVLMIVGHGNGIKLANGVVAFQDAARVFPGNGRTGFHLRPGNLGSALAHTALGHEVKNTAFSFGIAWEPVLHSRIFNFRPIHGDEFHHRGVQLVFITRRSCAAFQIGNITVSICNQQGSFKLAAAGFIDTEIGRKFHRAFDAFRNIAETTV